MDSLHAHVDRYHRGHLIMIDVSQSVEHEHPRVRTPHLPSARAEHARQAIEFLRRDCVNVNRYFQSQGRFKVATVRGLNALWGCRATDDGRNRIVRLLHLPHLDRG